VAQPSPPSSGTTKSPIRIVLEKSEAAPPPAEPAEEAEEGVSAPTGLVLGLIILVGMVFATLPTVVFFVLACVLALLHREWSGRQRTVEEYASLIPAQAGRLFQRFHKPDGRLILALLLLGVALFLVPWIVFGLAGAAALVTALYVLDFLDRPATSVTAWLEACEQTWADRLKTVLQPDRCHLLAVLSLFPLVYYLASVFLPMRFVPAVYWRAGLAGGVVVACLVAWASFLRPGAGASRNRWPGLPAQTLLVSTVVLTLGLGCASILMTRQMKIPFLAEGMEWNGIWLAALPAVALWIWHRGYAFRQRHCPEGTGAELAPGNSSALRSTPTAPAPASASKSGTETPLAQSQVTPDSGPEFETWRFSGLTALMTVGSGFLLWRALTLQNQDWGNVASAALFTIMLVGWFVLAWLLLGLVRASSGPRFPEWMMVHLATMVSLILCFFMVHFGGAWGLAAAMVPVVLVWREARRLVKKPPNAAEPHSSA
jgi:hypothetical protein